MGTIVDALKLISENPFYTILVIAGIGFVFFAIVGYIPSGTLNPLPVLTRIMLTVVGAIFIALSIALAASDLPPDDAPSPTATPEPTRVADTGEGGRQQSTAPPANTFTVVGHEVVEPYGVRQIALSSGELIAGTGDRFGELADEIDPPCTAFVIRGPIEMEIVMWWGGWDHYANAFDDSLIDVFLQDKVRQLQRTHETCPSRGIRTYVCRGSDCVTEVVGD